ncbi:hypothetical protein CCR94_05350 [Rhodoblastus sphagnicola]|uniref:Uncharacterized protein n=1 Tax=Rhodoblastus sphagnicola TaxID=333368 RepID=A0A2S6NDD5_9HYPH|nr:hypothetical protein [Rhodoblastus sphagnicola]MBB4197955.1 hypothetical protein [Rhodoblastus sphagnicola]PPQ32601.1 hypothetical protein CCR94_05350 [Rhodoblastus sphagnicola]
MKTSTIVLAALVAWSACAEAKTPERQVAYHDALIRLIADATAWSEFCVNDAVDPAALAVFREVHGIAVNGHYIEVFGRAHARQHAAASAANRFFAACARALALYGPSGNFAPGLVRPLFHATVPDQMIDLDRW